jgi:hypothetical protein
VRMRLPPASFCPFAPWNFQNGHCVLALKPHTRLHRMERLESIGSPVPATLMEGEAVFAEGKTVVDAEAGCVWFIPTNQVNPIEPSPNRQLFLVAKRIASIPIRLQAIQARHLWLFNVEQSGGAA